MHKFIVASDNVFRYDGDTVVLGLEMDMSLEAVRKKIERYFPPSSDLAKGYRLETMLMVPLKSEYPFETIHSFLPLSSLAFQAKGGNERYVLLEKRDPDTKAVIFKDDDTFFEDDPKYPDIKEHLIKTLVDNFTFYADRYKTIQDTVA